VKIAEFSKHNIDLRPKDSEAREDKRNSIGAEDTGRPKRTLRLSTKARESLDSAPPAKSDKAEVRVFHIYLVLHTVAFQYKLCANKDDF
jgi:hypothetical protein